MENEKSNILNRVCSLYNNFGIKSITMDDVSRELGISKKTLYEHFKDKDDLVSQVFEFERKNVLKNLCEAVSSAQNAIHELFLINKYFKNFILNIFKSFRNHFIWWNYKYFLFYFIWTFTSIFSICNILYVSSL